MTARDVRKNFNVYVDGVSYAGETSEFNPPKLTMKTEEFRAGGMNGPIKLNMGSELMDCDFSMWRFSKDLLSLYGLAEGQNKAVTLREALESNDGTVTPVVHTMRGKITEVDHGTLKAGDPNQVKLTMNLSYYKLQHGTTVVIEIDLINMVQIINGVDQLAKQRAALGL